MTKSVRVGVLGCGNVGTELVVQLTNNRSAIAERTGVDFELAGIGVRDLTKSRDSRIDTSLFTDDLDSIVSSNEIQVIVEVMGGIDPAHDLISKALASGKPVISANKELIAEYSSELFELARKNSVDLLFEAAVGGGVPIIRPLRESLAGENITSITGIINGTTNFVLSKMAQENVSFEDAVRQAQMLGYAEPDPSYDLDGRDAAAKAAILASLAFGSLVTVSNVEVEGITSVDSDVISFANRLNFVVKPLATVERYEDGSISVHASPAFVPTSHPLSAVNDVFNAVYVKGESVGELMLYGPGAGGGPTASAALGDLVDAAHNLLAGGSARLPVLSSPKMASKEQAKSAFFVEVQVEDQPGVLGEVASAVGECGISIQTLEQLMTAGGAQLLLITHVTSYKQLEDLKMSLESNASVKKIGCVMRVFGVEE